MVAFVCSCLLLQPTQPLQHPQILPFPRSASALRSLCNSQPIDPYFNASFSAPYSNASISEPPNPPPSSSDVSAIVRILALRDAARLRKDYSLADLYKRSVEASYSVTVTDRPGPLPSTWSRRPPPPLDLPGPSVLSLAHMALGARSASEVSAVSKLARERCRLLLSSRPAQKTHPELSGSKASDAAFWFVLSGCVDSCLLNLLSQRAGAELERFGSRASCRPEDRLRVHEKLAAGHLRVPGGKAPEHLGGYGHPRSLVWLFRFGARSRGQGKFLRGAEGRGGLTKLLEEEEAEKQREEEEAEKEREEEDGPEFDDPTKPLIVDVGCGFGTTLIGLARPDADEVRSPPPLSTFWGSTSPTAPSDTPSASPPGSVYPAPCASQTFQPPTPSPSYATPAPSPSP